MEDTTAEPVDTTTETPAEAPENVASVEPTEAPTGAEEMLDAAPETPQTVRIKVDGEERELTLDEAIVLAQKGMSADQRFQKAASMRKSAEDIFAKLKEDPWSVLSSEDIGHDPMKLAEEYILKQLKEAEMTPEQREAERIKRENEEYRRREAEREAKAKQTQYEQAKLRAKEEYERVFNEALDKSKLPRTAATLARMAQKQYAALKQGHELTPSQIAALVRRDLQNEMESVARGLDNDLLEKFIGKEKLDALRKAQVERVQQTQKAKTELHDKGPSPRPDKGEPLEWRDLEAKILGKYRG